MSISIKKVLFATLMLASSISSANAAMILNNTQEVEAISITESFRSFYDYNNGSRFASDTGLEVEDSFVFFLAQFNGQSALFGLLDGTNNGDDVLFDVALSDSSNSLGNLIFKDDPTSDSFSSSSPGNWLFEYNMRDRPGRGDGFVYLLGDGGYTSLDVSSVFNSGSARGAYFVSFENGNSEYIDLGMSLTSLQFSLNSVDTLQSVEVASPSTLGLFSLALMIFAIRKRRS
tara:strand:+ start:246 stop:938 length:693 start_codon:yes stop_codon:yes gene_type:complete